MLRKLWKDNKAGIEDLIPAAIVITVLVVLFAVIPVVGYNVDASWTAPAIGQAGSQWNHTTYGARADSMTNGSELWQTNSPLLALAVLIGIVFTAIGMLISSGNKISRGGGGM